MAKRVNYGFERRQKEIKRQKKQEEKTERKRLKKEPLDLDREDSVTEVDDSAETNRGASSGD